MPGGAHAYIPFANDGRRPTGGGSESDRLRAIGRTVIELEIDTERPRLRLQAPADKDTLPLVRQTLRALGQSVGAEHHALHDAELAVTEACANAVRHAYRNGDGIIDVGMEARSADVLVDVRDEGCGMEHRRSPRGPVGGLGLTLIEAITDEVELRSRRGAGTEVLMTLPLDRIEDGSPLEDSPVDRVVRRLVAMAAAQTDMTPERITEALLVAEIVARHAPRRLIGKTIQVRVDRLAGGVDLLVGPLEADGTAAILSEADMPIVGSVVERLASEVWAVPTRPERPSEGEQLALRFAA